jgi:hypothetical protein
MTRPYALRQLLKHGPLSFTELREITGWPTTILSTLVQRQMETGAIYPLNLSRRRVYVLA